MLFRSRFYPLIASGEVTVAFRRWTRPTVKAGGTLQTYVGVLAIDSVDVIDESDITPADLAASGHSTLADLVTELGNRPGDLYRIRFHLAGEDPRIALRDDDQLSDTDLEAIALRLERLDKASSHGPWTMETLELIERLPATRAGDLAASVSRETPPFKVDVRKLKNLGLTESLGTGYRVSPRGARFLAWSRSRPQ